MSDAGGERLDPAHLEAVYLQRSQEVPSSFFGSISGEVLRDPVMCADGHTYEREMISLWLSTKHTSPLTGQKLAHKRLVPNYALRGAMLELSTFIASGRAEGALPSGFIGPLSGEVFSDPVLCADGHTYERRHIKQWMETNALSPTTHQPLAHNRLVPNFAVKSAIEEHRAAFPEHQAALPPTALAPPPFALTSFAPSSRGGSMVRPFTPLAPSAPPLSPSARAWGNASGPGELARFRSEVSRDELSLSRSELSRDPLSREASSLEWAAAYAASLEPGTGPPRERSFFRGGGPTWLSGTPRPARGSWAQPP